MTSLVLQPERLLFNFSLHSVGLSDAVGEGLAIVFSALDAAPEGGLGSG